MSNTDQQQPLDEQVLLSLILSRSPTVEGIVDLSMALLNAEDAAVTESINHSFTEGTFKVVLDWIAQGEVEQIHALIQQTRSSPLFNGPDGDVLGALSPRQRVLFKLEVLNQLLCVFLRTDCLSRGLAFLLGDRYRRVLVWIVEHGHEVTVGDLVDAKLVENEASAEQLLSRFVDERLLSRSQYEGAVKYSLDYLGFDAARVITQANRIAASDGAPPADPAITIASSSSSSLP